jgi:ubiquinone biosynthesis protein
VRDVAETVAGSCSQFEAQFDVHRETVSDIPMRLGQTALALAAIAADYRLFGIRSAFLTRDGAADLLDAIHERSARRFVEVSLEHGGAFLKVGQLLSARADVMPEAWIRALEPLQDSATPIPGELAEKIVERELKRPLTDVFASFDATPLAAASIGQVHRARLLDGTEVAVKVQRPGIGDRIRVDLLLLDTFVKSMASSLGDVDYQTVLTEIRTMVLAELDYVREARITKSVFDSLAHHEGIAAPEPVLELCSARVLVTRFVKGRKITTVLDELAARRDAIEPRDDLAHVRLSEIMGQLLEAYLRQVLTGGVFQADPHPGNLMVRDDGAVVVLDFGSATILDDVTRQRYLALLGAALAGNTERVAELFGVLGFQTRSGRPDTLHLFTNALLGELRQAVSGKVHWPTRDEFAARIAELIRATESDPVVRLPSEFVSVARVFATLAGLFSKYEPDMDFGRFVLPTVGTAFFSAL